MKGRMRTRIAVPPHILRRNPTYYLNSHLEKPRRINHNGNIFIEDTCAQVGDLRLWIDQFDGGAAAIAKLIGKPKKTVMRWCRADRSQEDFLPISRDQSLQIESAIARSIKTGLPIVFEYGGAGVKTPIHFL